MTQKLKPQAQTLYGTPQGTFSAYSPAPIVAQRAPTTSDTGYAPGQIWVNQANDSIYALSSVSAGSADWESLGGSSSDVNTINNLSPTNGNITIAGTANQISIANAGSTVTLSLPNAITTPGSLTTTSDLNGGGTVTAGTGVVATTGGITAVAGNIGTVAGDILSAGSLSCNTTLTVGSNANITGLITGGAGFTTTNGSLTLGTAGNKINIAVGANASIGITGNMSGTPGVVSVSSTAITTNSVILYSRATTGGTPGQVSITSQTNGGFTLTSTGNETSTFYYLIIN